jgi:hypothetical protein
MAKVVAKTNNETSSDYSEKDHCIVDSPYPYIFTKKSN